MKRERPCNRQVLARRLREIRLECYGLFGEDKLAEDLNLPARTWQNYENGATIPGPELLVFMARTHAHPTWLLQGTGERYVTSSANGHDRRQ